ncbi:hypothetical protein BJY52DRAFT_1418548 [Lactarius psammicola]|nr:hypothetical protein BJY52DRAFT_1418548 [Lactarius psammicola]
MIGDPELTFNLSLSSLVSGAPCETETPALMVLNQKHTCACEHVSSSQEKVQNVQPREISNLVLEKKNNGKKLLSGWILGPNAKDESCQNKEVVPGVAVMFPPKSHSTLRVGTRPVTPGVKIPEFFLERESSSCSLQLAEPITSLAINPYINQLVSELPIVGGDERKVGYYAGLIVSLYFAAEAVTVLQWSRLSDYVGRKPVCSARILGIVHSNWAVHWWCAIAATGSLAKCLLASFLGRVPILPALSCYRGIFSPIIFSGRVFLKETVNSDHIMKSNTVVNSDLPRVGAEDILDGSAKNTEEPVPLRALLTRPVVISVANYGMIALLNMSAGALIPLVWSTSVEFGGLGMSPASIGLWMGGYGFTNGIFQFVAFPRIVGRFGPRRVFITSIFFFFAVYSMFPIENLALRHSSRGLKSAAALFMVLHLLASSFSDMGFSAVFMYLSSAAPNKRSLGATNGVAQTVSRFSAQLDQLLPRRVCILTE